MEIIYGLSGKEASALIDTLDGQIDKELNEARGGEACDRYFRLQDGRVLRVYVQPSGKNKEDRIVNGVLYSSRDAAVKALEEYLYMLEESSQPRHRFAGMLPPPALFFRRIPAYIAKLSGYLAIPEPLLNKSPESLDTVEAAMRQVGVQRFIDEPELLTALSAYVGEVLRLLVQGEWDAVWAADDSDDSEYGEDGEDGQGLWTPVIVDKHSRIYPTLSILHKLLNEFPQEIPALRELFVQMVPTMGHSLAEVAEMRAQAERFSRGL